MKISPKPRKIAMELKLAVDFSTTKVKSIENNLELELHQTIAYTIKF